MHRSRLWRQDEPAAASLYRIELLRNFLLRSIDAHTLQLRYVNAGHNPPCLLRCAADQSIQELPAGGTVIGLFPQSSYEEAVVELRPGDVLLAFTGTDDRSAESEGRGIRRRKAERPAVKHCPFAGRSNGFHNRERA